MVAISRNLSNKHSMEMLLTGELISSDKAAKIGLINDVIEINKLKDFVLNKASKISKKSSVTLKIGKEAIESKEIILESRQCDCCCIVQITSSYNPQQQRRGATRQRNEDRQGIQDTRKFPGTRTRQTMLRN